MTLNEWVKLHHEDPTEEFLKDARANHLLFRADAHMEVFSLLEGVYSFRMEGPRRSPPAWAHLDVGEDSALLIDDGYGVGNIRRIVESLLKGKPYKVVNTHVHNDHVCGNFCFDRVYIHEGEAELLREHRRPETLDAFFNGADWILPEDDRVRYHPYEIVPCQDGFLFSLGPEHQVELVSVPGHSPGSALLLDHRKRILFSADSVLLKLERFFEDYPLDGLRRLSQRTDEFDYVFPGHAKLMLPPSIVTDTYNAVHAFFQDPESNTFTIDRFGKGNKVFISGDAGIILIRSKGDGE